MSREPAPMYYSELEPSPELRPWIAAWWHFRVAEGVGAIEHWIPLTGGAMLSLPRHHPAGISGPRVSPLTTTVRGGEVYWGAHFWPGAAASILGPEARELREQQLPAEQVLPPDWVDRLRRRLAEEDDEAAATGKLDQAFGELAAEASPLDDVVMTAVVRLLAGSDSLTVSGLAEELGLSPRQLRRRFRRAVELTPKELMRLQRMRASAVAAVQQSERWVDVAAEHGYADQAHLVREYRRLIGLTPTGFGDHTGRIRHGRILR